MNNKEILDNAPEGATHWDCNEYMRHTHDGNWDYWSKAAGWNETKPEEETRLLADIKRIVELEKERDELKEENSSLHAYAFKVIAFVTRAVEKLKGIPEFKPTGDVLNRVLRVTPKIALEAHNLDQQAKGAMKAANLKLRDDEVWSYASQHVETLADDLLSRSEELKEKDYD
jgi:hypothetical protein